MVENWKQISGYEDYDVSDQGRARSLKFGKIKILKPDNNGCGYLRVHLYIKGKRTTRTVHSLVAEAFIGPRPEGCEVNHKDGIKCHNEATNLEWMTPAENTAHAERMGLRFRPRGERNSNSKLVAAQVVKMRRLHAEGASQRELIKLFETSQANVSRIVHFVSWRHLATA